MSSTTDQRRQGAGAERSERGQVLVIFAGGMVAFLLVASLVFDVGQNLLMWRAQRDAADASALAGARYINQPGCLGAPSIANCPDANSAALIVARANGFGDLDGDGVSDHGTVTVHIPPRPGTQYGGQPGFVEVDIHTDRPSFFTGILGIATQNVDALAVAANGITAAAPYSLLALNQDCSKSPSGQVGGNGTVNVDADVNGEVRVNADCDNALLINGKGSLTAPKCTVAGTAQVTNNATLDCTLIEGGDAMPDPLSGFGPPPGGAPGAVEVLDGADTNPSKPGVQLPPIPTGCPDGLPPASTQVATAANPVGCQFIGPGGGGSKYTIYRIHPGTYYGGLAFSGKVRVYLAPGVYWIAGGGFNISGVGAQVASMDRTNVAADPYPTVGRGVLIYNSEDAAFSLQCADPAFVPVGKPCIAEFNANGGSDSGCTAPPAPAPNPPAKRCAWLHLEADDENGFYPGLVFFQDRRPSSQPTLKINGNTGIMEMFGTVYSPGGEVQINGSADDAVAAQVIANTFKITGQGVFNLTYNGDWFVKLSAAGLVQ